jgi:CRP/FNR family transcriptional regulator, anaerobic regulatory protein
MPTLTLAELETYFPFLQHADTLVQQQAQAQAMRMELPADTHICWEGDTCQNLALLLSGTVRVYKIGETGREITLYRLERHESCVLTASCILSQRPFPALAITETPVQAILIPAPVLRQWVAQFDGWRNYIFDLMAHRLTAVITTVEEVAFGRMDARLARFLAETDPPASTLHLTHQEIASELGTAREVISRILKDFEKEGLIGLARGQINLLDRSGLHRKADTV